MPLLPPDSKWPQVSKQYVTYNSRVKKNQARKHNQGMDDSSWVSSETVKYQYFICIKEDILSRKLSIMGMAMLKEYSMEGEMQTPARWL